ncbi:hypothetical protein L226DRAFT_617386 [Lentinus tigrinus ALCF2SS1-7]|uniref:Uncharacterized protein n=1 Tax=Lentinus tigrinus ALCF2SS1-6 TaxID=1328759 RepID=A0A5C2RTA5_9APHY|nr:hypothetical protein L227DRAFT_658240 [Lentinus tigrinus ALCF2SS1-6]RPD68671.1 hypothetical protein L226DRAFT_617386 [Lentinus tigrinus ALCF2SS1-7]
MNSSDPTPSSSQAPAAPEKPEPWSMEHWTSGLVTRKGIPLPRGTVAYAIGLAFPPEHVRPIAEVMCTPEEIKEERDDYLAALLFKLIAMDNMQTILHIADHATKKPLMLWVLRVTPGRAGKLPTERIEPERWTLFYQYLYRRGLSIDVLKSFRKCITRWPRAAAYPVWVPDMLLYKLQLQAKEKQAAETDKNASKAGEARALPEHRSSS